MGKKGLIELSVAKQSTRLPWDSSWGREGWLQCCTGQGYSGIPRDGRIFPPELVLQARCGKPGEETQVITFFFFFLSSGNSGRAKISVLILYSSSLSYDHPYSQIYYRKHPYPLTFSRKEKFLLNTVLRAIWEAIHFMLILQGGVSGHICAGQTATCSFQPASVWVINPGYKYMAIHLTLSIQVWCFEGLWGCGETDC